MTHNAHIISSKPLCPATSPHFSSAPPPLLSFKDPPTCEQQIPRKGTTKEREYLVSGTTFSVACPTTGKYPGRSRSVGIHRPSFYLGVRLYQTSSNSNIDMTVTLNA